MRLLEQFVGAATIAALAISAGCGSSGRHVVATDHEPLSEPPQPPLATIIGVELPTDSPRANLIGMAAGNGWVRALWVEALEGGTTARWAELGTEGRLRWVRSLPFVPSHYGRIGERDVFVVEGRDGTSLCTIDDGCVSVSPMRGALVAFGRDEVLFDFGVGFIRAWMTDGIRTVPIQDARIVLRHVPERPRAGACGRRWIVVVAGNARWLDDLASSPWTIPDDTSLLATDRATYALAAGANVAVDVCSGGRIPVMPDGRGVRPSGAIAAFRGREGLALLRRAVLDDGHSWFRYDYAGTSEVLYECEDFDCEAPRIIDAVLDRRGNLWFGLETDGRIRVELRRHAPAR